MVEVAMLAHQGDAQEHSHDFQQSPSDKLKCHHVAALCLLLN